MTREEAIEIIRRYECNSEHYEACEMAIKALEQEPCDDCISRQAAIDAVAFGITYATGVNMETGEVSHPFAESNQELRKAIHRICELPPVNPQPKTGHWIMPVQDDGMSDPIYYQVRCSKCGFDLDPQTWHMELHQYGADKYCPKCGFRMVEPQESEG